MAFGKVCLRLRRPLAPRSLLEIGFIQRVVAVALVDGLIDGSLDLLVLRLKRLLSNRGWMTKLC